MILTFIQIFKWIQIATVDGFEIDENGSSSNIYKYANRLVVYLDEYKQVASMLVIFCFLKIMKYIDFSYKLSIFYETIKESSYSSRHKIWAPRQKNDPPTKKVTPPDKKNDPPPKNGPC